MEMLKCKTTIFLVIMILGVAFIGGMDNVNLDNHHKTSHNIFVNA